jgi:hypothetical protein
VTISAFGQPARLPGAGRPERDGVCMSDVVLQPRVPAGSISRQLVPVGSQDRSSHQTDRFDEVGCLCDPWAAETGSRGASVFVDQAAERVAPVHACQRRTRVAASGRDNGRPIGWLEVERAVRSVAVVGA